MNTFASFDGIRIAYHDEGEGPAVILLHVFATSSPRWVTDPEEPNPISPVRLFLFRHGRCRSWETLRPERKSFRRLNRCPRGIDPATPPAACVTA
jgi:hypothetical protein